MDRQELQEFLRRAPEPAVHAYDVYRRATELCERTHAAMGRRPSYRVSVSTTDSVRVTHANRRGTPEIRSR